MPKNQTACVTWRDSGVPVSSHFDDPYFSLEDGLAETRHVFLAGNGLPDRFCPGFQIAELGFGTGLNFLASLQMWRETGQAGRLRFTSFEAFPMAKDDTRRALAAFPSLAAVADEWLDAWQDGGPSVEGPDYSLTVIPGDARETLSVWDGLADAWFLDGFAPAKNPELWEKDLMGEVARHMAPSGTLATYSAAGFVRRSLEDSGLVVRRVPGFARKRHMTVAHKEGAA